MSDDVTQGSDTGRTASEPLNRLLAFSDAVVAIAITLIVLPLVDAAMEAENAAGFFADNVATIASAALSFVVVSLFWRAHHLLFADATGYTPTVLRLELVWLATIAFLPVATALDLAGAASDSLGIAVYVGSMTLASLILNVERVLLTRAGHISDGGAPAWQRWITPLLLAIALVLVLLVPAVGAFWLLVLLIEIPVRRIAVVRRQRSR
ncbi:TMEM175 family protein [Homoserinibacter sp. GY 40078]|uniref:TMEM175 family protein n=1 Tax=Homoserinibacter sp. GY 40078 TaxID=2603275 RepID=UPI0011C7D29C|nr:TMEM175 family protein [Homoserinibacter sp. GY 40078]TXK19745.1 DUF1211 domain-containing protein [Homoserinibacter sp. GY 40078]